MLESQGFQPIGMYNLFCLRDLEGYFESLAPQGFQNNPFYSSVEKIKG